MVDGPTSKTTSLYLSEETRERIKLLADREGRSASNMAEKLLKEALDRAANRKGFS